MTATPYLLQLPDPDTFPGRALDGGFDSFIVVAESSADAKAMVQNYSRPKLFAGVSPSTLVEATNMAGWRFRVAVYNTDGSTFTDQTVTNSGQSEGTVAATGALTSTLNYGNGETVTIGTRVYTFQTVLTNTDGHILIGANEAASILNLHHAINNSGGVPGTDYFVTQADPNVTAVDDGAHILTVTDRVLGTAGNSVATTTTAAHATWGAATLTGGTNTTAEMSTLAELMVQALNSSGSIAGASFNPSTHTLTIAAASDNIGDHTVRVEVYPPTTDYVSPTGVVTAQGIPIPGFVGTITQGGSAGSALTAVVAADTYGIPNIPLQAKAVE